jgi:hypothetical protein
LPEVARGANEASEFRLGNLLHGGGCEQLRLAQIGDGARSVDPIGILNQDRADDHFERRSPRPPVLLALRLKKRIEVLMQYGQAFRSRGGAGLRAAARWEDRRGCAVRCGQSGARTHLFRTISTPRGQVKNGNLSFHSVPCSTVQVLANSQRWFKIGRHAHSLFAMFGVGCTISRECCGCLSV